MTRLGGSRSRLLALAAVLALGGFGLAGLQRDLVADASAQGNLLGSASDAPAPAGRKPGARPGSVSGASAPDRAPRPIAHPTPVQAAPPEDVAARLRENGAGTCAAQVDALAGGTMAGVQAFNTVSNWSVAGGADRLVSVAIGQKYPQGTPVPYGATSVMAAPNPKGGCDAMAVQVVPSPLTCAKLRDTMAVSQRQAGDLGGIPVMQAPDGQTLLVPTGTDACVLVAVRTAYAR